jgi:hypothetical protein
LLFAGLLQVVIRMLAASCYLQACCKLFRQFAASVWITSLDKSDKQHAASLLKSGLSCNLTFADLLQVDNKFI